MKTKLLLLLSLLVIATSIFGAEPKPRAFRGYVGAVTETSITLANKNHVLLVTGKTEINRGTNRVSLSAVKVGDEISGSFRIGPNGMELTTLNIKP